MGSFSFDRIGFKIDGQDAYLVSGEFHYFRVPREDWRRRMQLFIEAGGNCLATYVPWLIHEPEEGDIRFNDVAYRDLRGFLTLAKEMNIKVLLRPGPYQYSELKNAGIPSWLLDNYPELRAADINGYGVSGERGSRGWSVSYLHPTFLEKARKYFKAFADEVRPFMMENGGPVCMLQLDNELAGIHVWYGSLDYNPETMGFYRTDGRYPNWLRKKYGTIDKLNEAYGTGFIRFEYVLPIAPEKAVSIETSRRVRDYDEFYRDTMAEYLCLLASWLREDGLGGPLCHNSASPGMNDLFPKSVEALKNEMFLLGSDHYYTLNQNWPQNNPTPQYAIRAMMSCDMLRAMGMPPSVLEMPAGSASDTPPALGADLLACYMANLALGAKGVNYYVYTGGPNVPGTAETCDIYDYGAPVRADGSINEPGYQAIKTYGLFMKEHGWMQRAHRFASVQLGFEWTGQAGNAGDFAGLVKGSGAIKRFIEKGLLYTLMCSHYSPEMVLLTGELDVSRPLIVPCASAMSAEAQKAVVDFVKRGGKAMILPILPSTDFDYHPESALSSLFEGAVFTGPQCIGVPLEIDGAERVYYVNCESVCEKLPAGARVIATNEAGDKVVGFEMDCGAGKVLWFGCSWEMGVFPQARMMERFMELLDGEKCIESSNRNLFTTLWTNEEGKRIAFILNLYSSPQTSHIRIYAGGERDLGEISMNAMEVRAIEL